MLMKQSKIRGRFFCRERMRFNALDRFFIGRINFAPLAQLAEQVTLNHWVVGSIPTRCKNQPVKFVRSVPHRHKAVRRVLVTCAMIEFRLAKKSIIIQDLHHRMKSLELDPERELKQKPRRWGICSL